MNPLKKFRDYFIGRALAKTDDVFEHAKINLLFSFTVFFLVVDLIFTIVSLQDGFFVLSLSLVGLVFLIGVLFVLRRTGSVKTGAYMFILLQVIETFFHWLFGDGHLEMQAVCWLLLFIIFGFLVLGRGWGSVLAIFAAGIMIFTLVDEQAGFSFYKFPSLLVNDTARGFDVIVPFALITFLISQFVKARGKAEEQIQKQKILLEKSNSALELHQRDITSSINYAKRIQHAVLPQEEAIYRNVPLSFILYKPKDIVSGDFFWFHEIDRDNYIIVCADCTGHGVPGAMMTVIGSSLLNQTVIDNKITQPSQILLVLDNLINITLRQQKEHEHFVQDGMDLALLKVDKANKEFIFSSAKRPAVFIRNKEMQEFKGSKHTLGGMITGCKVFNEIKMNYREDDIIYFFTDGITDLFGGPKGKKFSSKQMKETLLGIHKHHMTEQKNKLEKIFEDWKGNLEQVDDVLVMGIKF